MWRKKNHEAEAAKAIHELTASRRRIAEAYEVERLRIERDLHDGAQQYFVAAAMKLGEAQLETDSPLLDAAAQYGPHITVRAPHPLPLIDDSVLAAAYFFTSEALTNAAKHAPGAPVSVLITSDATLNVAVTDSGNGGARIVPGGGLDGMRERIAAFGGSIELNSPHGGPTTITARIPLLLYRGESGLAQ